MISHFASWAFYYYLIERICKTEDDVALPDDVVKTVIHGVVGAIKLITGKILLFVCLLKMLEIDAEGTEQSCNTCVPFFSTQTHI